MGLLAVAISSVPTAPPPRTNRTRRVPHPVLIGHASSLAPHGCSLCSFNPSALRALAQNAPPPLHPPSCTNWTRLVPPSVLTGHVSSLPRVDPLRRGSFSPGHGHSPHPRALTLSSPPPPPPPSRTKWTRRVPHPVLIGHAASLARCNASHDATCQPCAPCPIGAARLGCADDAPGACAALPEGLGQRNVLGSAPTAAGALEVPTAPPPSPLVLSGHAASLTPY